MTNGTKSPTDQKYPDQPKKSNVPVEPQEPVLPVGAPKEVPGIYNDHLPLPEDPNAQTPTPAPGQPAV